MIYQMFEKRVSKGPSNFSISNSSPTGESRIDFEEDTVAVIESNVDDVTGEVLSATIERLIGAGALDATVSSFLGKKGRMGQTVRVVCHPDTVLKFSTILVEETGTMGVKVCEYRRLIVPRAEMNVHLELRKFSYKSKVKVAMLSSGPRFKVELEDAKKIAETEGIPLRNVLSIVSEAAEKQWKSQSSGNV
jgi:pyridinium-3,5-bisthiocarboxylic acid mononucleotide nickel chelatase